MKRKQMNTAARLRAAIEAAKERLSDVDTDAEEAASQAYVILVNASKDVADIESGVSQPGGGEGA